MDNLATTAQAERFLQQIADLASTATGNKTGNIAFRGRLYYAEREMLLGRMTWGVKITA